MIRLFPVFLGIGKTTPREQEARQQHCRNARPGLMSYGLSLSLLSAEVVHGETPRSWGIERRRTGYLRKGSFFVNETGSHRYTRQAEREAKPACLRTLDSTLFWGNSQ